MEFNNIYVDTIVNLVTLAPPRDNYFLLLFPRVCCVALRFGPGATRSPGETLPHCPVSCVDLASAMAQKRKAVLKLGPFTKKVVKAAGKSNKFNVPRTPSSTSIADPVSCKATYAQRAEAYKRARQQRTQ